MGGETRDGRQQMMLGSGILIISTLLTPVALWKKVAEDRKEVAVLDRDYLREQLPRWRWRSMAQSGSTSRLSG